MIFSLGSMVSNYAIGHILVPEIYSEHFIVKSLHLAKSMNCVALSLISCQVDWKKCGHFQYVEFLSRTDGFMYWL